MNYFPAYLDTSAIVKLVVPEPETDALLSAIERWPDRVSSVVATVEVHRALARVGATRAIRTRADAVLSGLVLVHTDPAMLARAAAFKDPTLRSLDAIHLAAALSLGDDPDAFVTYDARLGKAAARQRLRVEHPGVSRLT